MSDRQCPSCGGCCGYTKKAGCQYADLPKGACACGHVCDNTQNSLNRVIAEQQTQIDRLKDEIRRAHETLGTMWTQHGELFESFARLVDAQIPKDDQLLKIDEYRKLRHECRMHMMEADYCMTCYNFVCECEGQYD